MKISNRKVKSSSLVYFPFINDASNLPRNSLSISIGKVLRLVVIFCVNIGVTQLS